MIFVSVVTLQIIGKLVALSTNLTVKWTRTLFQGNMRIKMNIKIKLAVARVIVAYGYRVKSIVVILGG